MRETHTRPEVRYCTMTLTTGGPCPGFLIGSVRTDFDTCTHCGTWIGKIHVPRPDIAQIQRGRFR
jgi:hypothetical protein